MFMNVLFTSSVIILQIFCTISDNEAWPTPKRNYEWDILMFSQRWPYTACSQWQEANAANTCSLPLIINIWTAHGIWPTKSGTIGPGNCNNTWHFNQTQLEPIKKQLDLYWTNIEKNTAPYSFWKHEWTKHGTCATVLPQLDSELKYFTQGLVWIKKYNMGKILAANQIVPNAQGYPVELISNTIQSKLKKIPIIECVIDKGTKLSLISEIRICFNKTLDLVDCTGKDGLVKIGKVLTNCNTNVPVMYLNTTVTYKGTDTTIIREKHTLGTVHQEANSDVRELLFTIYNTAKFLIWAML